LSLIDEEELEALEGEEGELVELDEVEVRNMKDEEPDEPPAVTVTVFGVVAELLLAEERDEEVASLEAEVVQT
jgi:hypothetical protein